MSTASTRRWASLLSGMSSLVSRCRTWASTVRSLTTSRWAIALLVGWVPEHFYAEVLGVLRRRLVGERSITETAAASAVAHLRNCTSARRPFTRSSIRHGDIGTT